MYTTFLCLRLILRVQVLTQILENLNFSERLNAALTCKSWYYASCDPRLTKQVRVRFKKHLEDWNRPFTCLVLQNISFDKFNYKEFFEKFGHRITHVEFSNCAISLNQLIDCLIGMPRLLNFKVASKIISNAIDLSDSDFNTLKTNLNRIENFDIEIRKSVGDWLIFLMSMMENLRTLFFNPYMCTANNAFKDLFGYMNKVDEVNLYKLDIIKLAGTKSEAEFYRSFSQVSSTIKIHTLAIDSAYSDLYQIRPYDPNFETFCKKLSCLKSLSMQAITVNHLLDICRHMIELVDLNLFGMQIRQIRIIGTLAKLEKLNLSCLYTTRYDKEELNVMLTKLRNLKELVLNCVITKHCLDVICKNGKNLTKLILRRIQTNNVQSIFKNLSNLKCLHLSFNVQIDSDTTVESDITNLKFLEELQISRFVPGITLDLIRQLSNLKVCDVPGTSSLVL